MSKKAFSELTIIGIDYGRTNIGVAIGKNGLVSPLRIIPGKNIETAIHELSRLAFENKIDLFVVGLPLSAEDKETKQSLEVRHFVKLLKLRTKKPVEFKNEYGTTTEALKEAISSGINKKDRKTSDHISAALILKSYCEERSE